ncbi:MAG: 4Fe-4S binding protein [Anaerolineales bacterium]|nr:4Fe-4S binding protein [Anaerolineales bacterium]
MTVDVYRRLAHFLDQLPGGFPATDSGVEFKILQRLFSPEEAEHFMHLSLIEETAKVIGCQASKPVEEVSERLAGMERKGLVYARLKEGHDSQYSAVHFVVGIYEFQLNKMDTALVEYFEAYLPYFIDPEVWSKVPQLRTIPIGESVAATTAVMDYERAEALIQRHDRISVANCICRLEKEILGEPCVKPVETCLSFGSGADFYVRNAMGRYITQEEALGILRIAEENGLVLQPDAAQETTFICCCCGCCCGVLRTLKNHPAPAEIAASAFVAVHDEDLCDGCGLCQERSQMDALYLDNGIMSVDRTHCIGCGLCITTCPNEALTLERKPEAEERYVPRTTTDKYIHLAKTRGVLDNRKMAKIFLQSRKDRLLAERDS